MITNEAADYASREIALNLDNDGVELLQLYSAIPGQTVPDVPM